MFLLSILLLYGLTVDHAFSVILPKRPANPGEFPYHVSIQDIVSSYHHCGGVIVHPSYVMTAAHCIYGFNSDEFQIVAGTVDLSGKEKIIRQIDKLIPHEDYDESTSWKKDIGLLRVGVPFHFDNTIRPAKLSEKTSHITPNSLATVIGFGRIHLNGFLPKTLQIADVLVKDNEDCHEKYKKVGMTFTSAHICAQSSNGAGICKGDSGGAFIIDGSVVGISSFTNGDCDHVTYPSVFTKISEYIPWIYKQLEGHQ